ncbi:TIGR04283 family arsenosugar biosynthesis glycosyltransferase [Clostridium sp. C105KSO13]|uniref:TIGR04283 family arsenosugar biosynthesis glycosyltransferase n=1 Tax=Clostridium sp. C105KSO13 TaxID=1776045 RepID=UPI000740621F|nr:TIGR04283 family arsenosugar biosynthesis glycosyltransferase [Clostridium sp. C105KSO13]CUX31206.1 N-glycosyltransferase [Clostridium sp. C105KSO13]
MKEAILIFTRIPVPGHTKTRMMPYLSEKECAQLHICFLKDIERECQKTGRDLYVFFTPEGKQNILFPIFGRTVKYREQKGGCLGERMKNALEAVFREGYRACILIGTDIPELRASYLENAFEKLRTRDVVLGATSDGGYYLIGMKQLYTAAFENQTYGHETVFENTVEALKDKNISIDYVPQLSDLDRPGDLQEFTERYRNSVSCRKRFLNRQGETYSENTRKFILSHRKISIIIPTYNEEKTITHIQKQLEPIKDKCEIIFADGGSTDKTLEKIKKEFKIIRTKKGRGCQMNAGAKASHGDILFFLHCDSCLPPNTLEQIRYVTKKYRVGGFGVAFASPNFFMLTCRIISNYRMKVRGIIFGDQGMFIERKLFLEMEMFPEIPLMEDYQFSLDLKKRREKIGMTTNRIYTSDRRYPKGTIPKLRLMGKMYSLRRRYRKGESVEKIAEEYRDIR